MNFNEIERKKDEIHNYQVSSEDKVNEILTEINHKSHHSSSLISTKTTYLMFNSISAIQSYIPVSLKKFSLSLVFEVFMIVIYFSVLYVLYQDYVGSTAD